MLLWHLVSGGRDTTVCRMVPTPKVKGLASSPQPPQGRVRPLEGLAWRRADQGALAPSILSGPVPWDGGWGCGNHPT